jgi:Fic family protein
VPNNDLQGLPPDVDFRSADLLVATIAASKAISQLRTRLTLNKRTVKNTLDLLSPLFVPEAVASSGVEIIITTNDSVYVARIKEERELTPAEKEAISYVEALVAGATLVDKKGFLATSDYIEIQSVLEPSRRGIRNYTGTELRNPLTGRIYYTPPVGEGVIRDKLANFEKYFNDKAPDEEVYARMAILHYQFEAIHPFGDGNGRTGRMLMPLYLTIQKELPVPVLFISRYILNHRDEYYEKLRGVTEKNRWKEWILYIIEATREQAAYTCGVLEKIQANIAYVKELLRLEKRSMYSSELVDFLFSKAYFTEKEFEMTLGVSMNTARKYLFELEGAGIIEKKRQENRNRFLYINPRYINILLGA